MCPFELFGPEDIQQFLSMKVPMKIHRMRPSEAKKFRSGQTFWSVRMAPIGFRLDQFNAVGSKLNTYLGTQFVNKKEKFGFNPSSVKTSDGKGYLWAWGRQRGCFTSAGSKGRDFLYTPEDQVYFKSRKNAMLYIAAVAQGLIPGAFYPGTPQDTREPMNNDWIWNSYGEDDGEEKPIKFEMKVLPSDLKKLSNIEGLRVRYQPSSGEYVKIEYFQESLEEIRNRLYG